MRDKDRSVEESGIRLDQRMIIIKKKKIIIIIIIITDLYSAFRSEDTEARSEDTEAHLVQMSWCR